MTKKMTTSESDEAVERELQELYKTRHWYDLALHPALQLHPEWIPELYADGDVVLHTFLASNPAIANSPDIALALSRDPEQDVREALAENPAIDQHPEIETAPWSQILALSTSDRRPELGHRLVALLS